MQYHSYRGAMAAAAASFLIGALPVAAWADGDAPATDHSEHQGHAGHQMTAEQIAMLKAKVPLYSDYTDAQINEGMTHMPPDTASYLSGAAVRDSVGVLGLGHGYAGDGNDQFKAGYAGIALVYPTAVGLGMTMMDSSHIQTAVNELEAVGAKTIVVLPSEMTQSSSLVRQWQYIFGMREDSAYLDVPRVQTKAKILMAQSPTRSPIIGRILAGNLKMASRNPAKEAALLVMHGEDNPADNDDELKNMARLAAIVKEATGIADVFYASLQDDAPAPIRAANVQHMREWVEKAQAAGKTVLVEPVLLTEGGSVTKRIKRDLDGLTYTVVDKGMMAHPLFAQWIQDTVAAELKMAR